MDKTSDKQVSCTYLAYKFLVPDNLEAYANNVYASQFRYPHIKEN